MTWEEFNRMRLVDNFYGCVAPDGAWFDSGMCYTTAVTHCCYRENQFGLSVEGEAEWMNTEEFINYENSLFRYHKECQKAEEDWEQYNETKTKGNSKCPLCRK